MPTIRLRKNAQGQKVFHVQVRVKGRPQQTASFPRLTDARRWAAQVESGLREGRHFPGADDRRRTLSELLVRYRRSVLPNKRPGTIKTQQQQIDWWHNNVGHMRLVDITPALLVQCRDLLSEERSPATVKRYLALLNHVFVIARREWQWIDSNPLEYVGRPKEPPGRVRFLSDEERPRLLAACLESRNPDLYPVVLMALSTGARKNEILSLTWSSIDLTRQLVTFDHTKTAARRSVPITGELGQVLRQRAKVRRIDTALVFPRPDGLSPTDIRSAWETALHGAGIEGFRFHDLRHSTASYLAMSGASLAEIADVLGHKTLAMVKRYAHLSDQHTAAVVSRMNEKFLGG